MTKSEQPASAKLRQAGKGRRNFCGILGCITAVAWNSAFTRIEPEYRVNAGLQTLGSIVSIIRRKRTFHYTAKLSPPRAVSDGIGIGDFELALFASRRLIGRIARQPSAGLSGELVATGAAQASVELSALELFWE